MKKKIMFLVNHEVVIYNFRKELVEELLEKGYEVIISSPDGEKIEILKKMGCKHYPILINRHSKNPFTELKLVAHYIKLFKDVKPDIILTYTIKPNIYGGIAATICDVPYIANITGLGSAVEKKGVLQAITTTLYKFSFRKIKRIFFQNEENLVFFLNKGFPIEKTTLLPGSGVNLKHFEKMDFPPNKTIEFVFISRIMKEKGIEHYLEAAQHIKGKYPNTLFHICGFCEEDYIERLNKLHNENVIIYHGMVDDIREILKNVHCTVHPTYYPEGMSNALLESAATGRALISTDRSGCREIIDNYENGYLIKQKDSQALIEALERFIELPYEQMKRMGIKSRKKVEDYFDREIVVKEYVKEINEGECSI